MANYFTHPYLSNSDLSALKQELSASDAMEYADALRFGTLVHAMILEPHKVDLILCKVDEYEYSKDEIDRAKKMRNSFLADDFCRGLLVKCEPEKEMYNESTAFSYNGIDFTLNTRRKYDGWLSLVNWGFDVKSTTATTQEGFLSAIRKFDYERARVFYAKGPGAIQDVIIGVSKINFKVFKVFMKHGDELWTIGERKCNELAYKYYMLKS